MTVLWKVQGLFSVCSLGAGAGGAKGAQGVRASSMEGCCGDD